MNNKEFKELNGYKEVECCDNCCYCLHGFNSKVEGCQFERSTSFEGEMIENDKYGWCQLWEA